MTRSDMLNGVEQLVIRTAELIDVDALRDVFRRSSLSIDGDRVHLFANPDTLEWAAGSVSEGRTRVAVVDDHVVGFVTTTAVANGLEVDDLFVDPEWMKQGIGRALVADVAALARLRKLQRISVTANEHALPFYERAGFVTHRIVETRFGPAPRMHLELAPDVESRRCPPNR